jgi:hypothetical protein
VRATLSSVNDRLPRGGWSRTWALAAILYALILGGWELAWRLRGWKPTVEAYTESWVIARRRVRPNSTVTAGTSRIQGALDPNVWKAATGQTLTQLALTGGSPISILEDLADDESYHGLVLADVLPFYTFDAAARGDSLAHEYLAASRAAAISPAKRWEAYLRTNVPSHFVFRREELLPENLVPVLSDGRIPQTPHTVQGPDRYHPLVFRETGVPANSPSVLDSATFSHLRRVTHPASGPELDQLVSRILRSAERIRLRGGRVVFILFDACGGRKIIEEALYPKERYWGRLRDTPGVLTIDTGDYPEISSLDCFDGSHIDHEDAPGVTRLIAKLVTAAPAEPAALGRAPTAPP